MNQHSVRTKPADTVFETAALGQRPLAWGGPTLFSARVARAPSGGVAGQKCSTDSKPIPGRHHPHPPAPRAAVALAAGNLNGDGYDDLVVGEPRLSRWAVHFVSSRASPGVQMADLVAYVLQRSRGKETHPDAQAGLERLRTMVSVRTMTWREAWPRAKRRLGQSTARGSLCVQRAALIHSLRRPQPAAPSPAAGLGCTRCRRVAWCRGHPPSRTPRRLRTPGSLAGTLEAHPPPGPHR